MNGFKYIRKKIINNTMDELASQLNVSKQTIYMWESGKKYIPEIRLKQLSVLSGVPEEYFLIDELNIKDRLDIKMHRLSWELNEIIYRRGEID